MLPGNVVSNGSFELPVEKNCDVNSYASGQTLGAWRVVSGFVAHDGPCAWVASDGDWSVISTEMVPARSRRR